MRFAFVVAALLSSVAWAQGTSPGGAADCTVNCTFTGTTTTSTLTANGTVAPSSDQNGTGFSVGTTANRYYYAALSGGVVDNGGNFRLDLRDSGGGLRLKGTGSDSSTVVEVQIGGTTIANNDASIAGFYPNQYATATAWIRASGKLVMDATDSSGTPGAATINKPSGQSAIAAAASTVVITNSTVKTTSIPLVHLQANDGTCTSIKSVIPAAGSFTVTVNAACTAATKIGWVVFN